jgi:hypothetical protein
VDTDISVEQNTSMAMDSSDKAHIGYVSWGWGLKYATDVSGSWVTTSVDAKAYDQAGAILALDHSDKVYISYCWGFSDWPAYSLHYATNVSGTWVNTAITLPGSVGTFTSLALDSAGNIYISYNGITNGNGYPKYATNASGSWVKTTVDWASGTGGFTSIGVDSTDKAHISYFDFSNEDLKYSTNASGTWVQTTLDSSGSVGWDTSLALDSSDKLHISYSFYDPATYTGALKYATNISGSWVTTTLDSGIGLKYTSIDVDSADKVHISYLGDSGLKYATNASGTWVTTTVDSSGYVGFSSIGVDSADKVHISYYDEYPNYDLKYATNASGSWETSTIDSAGKVGSLTSIAADSLDNIHIGYRDDSNNSLKYATNASGSWVTETACDRVFGDGEYPSIAVSGSGQVRISHHGLDGTLLLTSKSGPSCIDNDGDSYGNPASTACVYPQLDCKDNPSSDPPICGTCTCGNANCAPCARCINGGATEFNNDGIDSNCDGKDNNCFIATAAFGTEMGGKIPVLSRFRDTYLLNSAAGKAFVAAYYKYSPPLADCIAQRTWLRAVVRTLLLPVIGFVWLLI